MSCKSKLLRQFQVEGLKIKKGKEQGYEKKKKKNKKNTFFSI